jgi:amino acid adenylation domain-containing protein
LFIEVFPFAINLEAADSFRTLGAKCLAETQLFLRSALPATSSPTGATVGNAVLNFFTQPFGDFAGLPVRAEWVHSGHSDSVHACRLQVHDYEGTGRYHLSFDLNREVFPEKARSRAVKHFTNLLEAFVRNPDTPVVEVDVLTEDERKATVETFNAPAPHDLPDTTVIELFDRQVVQHPDRVALRELDRETTFSELAEASSKVASGLAKRGLTPGAPVAVFMRRSTEAVIAILGILKARGAYIPVDPAYPESRVRHILKDSGAKMVLTAGSLQPSGTMGDVAIIRIEDLEAGNPEPANAPDLGDLAYIIYTSGSTGLPKGVEIEHGGLADYLTWAARQYVRNDRLSFPLFTSLSFDLTVTSLYLPLITGGTLVIYPEPSGPVDTALMDVVGENLVDFIKLTPSHLSLLRQMDVNQSRIRRMVVGGEDFKTQLAAGIASQFGDNLEIYNEYGPTEAVVGCMIHRFDPSIDTESRVPIGRPADHVQLYVLNDALVPVAEGVSGELCITRFGLARGYRNQDDLTNERFVTNPHGEGGRLYRTGDLVRFVRPGVLEYLGRIDRQLKVSGYRVEPAEIESALLTHEAIEACVIKAVSHAPAAQTPAEEIECCTRCGLPSNFPNTVFDENGVCSVCRSYEAVKEHAHDYFRTVEDLKAVFDESSRTNESEYDCMMLLSGGKDSTYALCRLVDLGLKVYVFSLDNGYISEQAKDNIRRVVDALGVDHEFGTTPAMNAIFRDSLVRFSNVCQGCFKTIYTLSVNRARELKIPIIVTGLSRGQFFETRLTENLFRGGRCNPDEVDAAVLAARKVYHRIDDEVARSLDVSAFKDDQVFEEVRFVDFYRYVDVDLTELIDYLGKRVPWKRPSDTGRSTNCLVNDVGIYIHKKERGFHNYALPYSWDVRMGHKTRDEALEELDDSLEMDSIRTMLDEIGYDENRLASADKRLSVTAYYVADREISQTDLRRHLSNALPAPLIPNFFRRIETIPLTRNGKVDLDALPSTVEPETAHHEAYLEPEGAVQERLASIWAEVLGIERIGARDSFFALGGTSLAGMDVMLQVCNEFEVDLPLQKVFQHPTVEELAGAIEEKIMEEIEAMSEKEAQEMVDPDAAN